MAPSSGAPRVRLELEVTHSVAVWKRTATVFVAMVLVLVAGVVGSDGSVGASPAAPSATSGGELRSGSMAYLRSRSTPAVARVAARPEASTRVSAATSTWVVTYHGFPTAARASFQKAVDLWSRLVRSSVPIRVDATWNKMGTNILGGARPVDFYRGRSQYYWLPIALANAKTKEDLSPNVDIEAQFNSSGIPWYYGTDGATPANQVDLTTVVLHELGHGLGIVDSTEVTGGRGYFGYDGSPFIYDGWVSDSSTQTIVEYGSGTTALGTMLRSNKVYWGGPEGSAGSSSKTKLYAPKVFELGSSISHLDEDTYPPGNLDSLMTPYLDDGESVYDPGDRILGMLRDMGWITAGDRGLPGASTAPAGSAGTGRVDLSWTPPVDTGRVRLTGTRVYRFDDGASTPSQTYDVPPPATTLAVTGLANGATYRFAVAAANTYGLGGRSPLSEPMKPFDASPFTNASGLIRQQYLDFLGRQPTASELALWRTRLNAGTDKPQDTVLGIASLDYSATPRARMTRLYWAYFQRLPDFGGFTYWVGKLRAGTSLKKVSDTFAASSEFSRTYGSLTNTAFVRLVYVNVLDRQPDSKGLSYWVSRLDKKAISRGSVMLNFAESSENIRKMEDEVGSILLRSGMLRRMPNEADWDGDLDVLSDGALVNLAWALLATDEYRGRFS